MSSQTPVSKKRKLETEQTPCDPLAILIPNTEMPTEREQERGVYSSSLARRPFPSNEVRKSVLHVIVEMYFSETKKPS